MNHSRSILSLFLLFLGCSPAGSQDPERPASRADSTKPRTFLEYWHAGKAEISRYALTQARYGELREGEAVLIFVTEDFLLEPQVKLESKPAGRAYVPVLKLNLTKNFLTGIYPYSMMTSVFSPEDLAAHPHALKVTTSSQEWCGHTWRQINLRRGRWRVTGHSYFEKEGDEEITLDTAVLEDELWTRIRMGPEALPVEEIRIVPGTMTGRLRHRAPAIETATATLAEDIGPERQPVYRYTITYGGDRSLAIVFEADFPYAILEWSETYMDGAGPKAKPLTTRAVRTGSMMIDYWNRNGVGDTVLRWRLEGGNGE